MNDEDFKELVGMAIGEASTAWTELPTGVFKASLCANLIERICEQKDRNFRWKMARALEGF